MDVGGFVYIYGIFGADFGKILNTGKRKFAEHWGKIEITPKVFTSETFFLFLYYPLGKSNKPHFNNEAVICHAKTQTRKICPAIS